MPSKSIPIVLKDGKTRQLRYEWSSLCRLKREHGISAFDIGREQLLGSVDPLKITGLVWAGLIHAEPELTIAEVEELIDISESLDLMGIVADALLEAIHGEEKAGEVKKAIGSSLKNLTGTSTSPKVTK